MIRTSGRLQAATHDDTRRGQRVAFISTMPPQRGNLAEYGKYLCEALAETDGIAQIDVLANQVDGAPAIEQLSERLVVRRVWRLDSVPSILGLARHVHRLSPDVVHVNAGIRTWGASRAASFAGAGLCPLLRGVCRNVVTTLHTIGETVRLDQMGPGIGVVTRMGMRAATRLYLRSSTVTVTLPSMSRALQRHFGARNVVHIGHGTYGARVDTPPLAPARVLSFGFWGAFKDAHSLVEAITTLRDEGLDVELVLGGGRHPYLPHLYNELASKLERLPFVRMTGYVPEEELPALFCSAAVVVLPYRSNAGASGVLNLSRSYGRPVLLSSDSALIEQVRLEGGGCLVYSTQDALVDGLRRVLTDQALQQRIGQANLHLARHLTIAHQAELFAQLYSGDLSPSPAAPEYEDALDRVVARVREQSQQHALVLPPFPE